MNIAKNLVATSIAALSIAAHSASPQLVHDGEDVTLIGRIRHDNGPTLYFTPDTYVITKEGQLTSTRFKVLPSEAVSVATLESLTVTTSRITCTVSMGDGPVLVPVCTALKAQRYVEPVVGPSQADIDREQNSSMRSFDPTTAGKSAMVFAKGGRPEGFVPRGRFIYVLYDRLPCKLGIVNANQYRRAEIKYGNGLASACWAQTLKPTGDEVILISQWGSTDSASLTQFYKGTVQKDGSIAVTGQAMSFDQVRENIKRYHDSLR